MQVSHDCNVGGQTSNFSENSEHEFSKKFLNYPPKSTCSDNQPPSISDNELVMGPTKFEPKISGGDGSLLTLSNKTKVSECPVDQNLNDIDYVSPLTLQDVPTANKSDSNKIQSNHDLNSVDTKDAGPQPSCINSKVQDFNIRYDFRCRSVQADQTDTTSLRETTRRSLRRTLSLSSNALSQPSAPLLGNLEENILNRRLAPVQTVDGFRAEIRASGTFCPRPLSSPVTVSFYSIGDSFPYLGHLHLGDKGYHIPRKDMPANSQTFLRQRTLYMPNTVSIQSSIDSHDPENIKRVRYIIHLRFVSSKSGRIYLNEDVRIYISRKSDLDAATRMMTDQTHELRSFDEYPESPRFSTRSRPQQ